MNKYLVLNDHKVTTGLLNEQMKKQLKKQVDSIASWLLQRQATLAVAESVTAGRLQAFFSNAEDASLFFQGGITVYNIGQKCRHLKVEPTHALACNCVSEKVSDQMALAVCDLFASDVGIGITGYASPLPEQNVRSLYSHISISSGGNILISKKVSVGKLKPEAAQLYFAEKAIVLLCEVLWQEEEE